MPARLIATVTIRAGGHRVIAKSGHHCFTFQAQQGVDMAFQEMAITFDAAQDNRNNFSCDAPIVIGDTDADDLLQAAVQFERGAEAWVKAT